MKKAFNFMSLDHGRVIGYSNDLTEVTYNPSMTIEGNAVCMFSDVALQKFPLTDNDKNKLFKLYCARIDCDDNTINKVGDRVFFAGQEKLESLIFGSRKAA